MIDIGWTTGLVAGGAFITSAFAFHVFRKRKQLGADNVIQAIATIVTAAGLLVSVWQGDVANAENARQFEVAKAENARQFAELRGAVHYKATRSQDWTLTLMPVREDGYLPEFVQLLPTFQQQDGTYKDGDSVEVHGGNATTETVNGHRVLQIKNADELVCSQQFVDGFDCDKTPLVLLWVRFDRHGDSVTLPFYRD